MSRNAHFYPREIRSHHKTSKDSTAIFGNKVRIFKPISIFCASSFGKKMWMTTPQTLKAPIVLSLKCVSCA